MRDMIYREDAIKEIEELPNAYNGWSDAYDKAYIIGTLEEVPKADRPQGWIPCSERLPSEQGEYLVTFPLCNGDPYVYVLSFCKGKFYETDDEWGDVEYDDVTAWMPLPKPYTADRKTEPQTIRCPKCGRSDYIREFGKDFSVTAEKAGFKYKCINCNTYIEPQSDLKTEPTGYNLLPVDKDINVRSNDEPQTERSE